MKRNQRNVSKRIARSPRPAPTFAYAEVESALAEVFDLRDVQQGIFRARLQNFRKLGIPARNPGKGQRLRYSVSDLFQLLIAIELTEFGHDPKLVAHTIKTDWLLQRGFFTVISYATRSPPPSEDVYVVMTVNVLSASLGYREIMQTNEGLSLRSEPNAITVFPHIGAGFTQLLQDPDFIRRLQEPRVRLSMFNLSDRIRTIPLAIR
ncbi:MAG: hypothetical protein ACXVBC_11085 [Bdellovibrionota bacterium]